MVWPTDRAVRHPRSFADALRQDLPVDRLRRQLEQAREALEETRAQLERISMADTCGTTPSDEPAHPSDVTYLESNEDGASKFWECRQEGNDVVIRYGKIGSQGRTMSKTFETARKAGTYMRRQIRAKRRKGYGET